MASRKQEKEARKQERLEAERRAEGEARRKRLLTGLGAAALAAVIVVVALIAISQSGGDDGEPGDELEGAGLVVDELDGIPQRGTVAGERSSEVRVVEYGDLQCPACAQFSETVIPEVLDRFVRSGDAALEFRNFLIIGPESETAAKAALAASEQDRYWQFIELFYRNQGPENSGYITADFLRSVAEGAGVPDLDAWEESLDAPKWDERLATSQRLARENGLNSTPSIVVEGPGGTEVLGSVGSAGEIGAAIDRVG